MLNAYYNEHSHAKAYHLRELIKAGHIPDGVVDARDIKDVQPEDLCGFTQCHFFADAGQWARALRLAGWPDDRPVWTGCLWLPPDLVAACDPAHTFCSDHLAGRLTLLGVDHRAGLLRSDEVGNSRGYIKAIHPAQAVPLIKAVMRD